MTRYIFAEGQVLVHEGPYNQMRGEKKRERERGVLIFASVVSMASELPTIRATEETSDGNSSAA